MTAKLKVFVWSDGFHAFTVAASSRPKALAAWGMGQDIFKSGLAREAEAGPAYDAALAAPGEVIQTGEAVDMGALEKAPKSKPKAGPTQAQMARIEALEAALATLDTEQSETSARLDAELEDLTKRRADLTVTQRREREALVERLKAARKKL